MILSSLETFRVLLVEDNRGDAILISEALREAGTFRLDRVDRLDAALERLESHSFDAILLDLGLPDSQGFETLSAVLARTRAPVLVLTGLDDESVGVQAVRHGAQDYLVKGRAGDELLRRALRFAIERARLQAALSTPLIEAAPVGLAVLDRDLHYLYVNPAMAKTNGVAPVAHLGQRIDRVVSDLGDGVFARLEGVIASGEPFREVELSGRTQAGEGTWLMSAEPLRDATGDTVGLTLSVVDITERKRKEEALAALAESRSQAQAIGEALAYGIWIADTAGRFTYFSPSFLELIGLSMDEAREFGWVRALAEDAVERTLRDWRACVESGGVWNYEHTVLGVDGRWHTVLSRGLPARDEAGRITSWAGINLDITERKQAEAFRDALIGVLSHELRTPITSIYAASAILRRPGLDGERREELLNDIGDEVERLRRLIEDLLVLARSERGAIQVETEPVLLQHVLPRLVAQEQRRWSSCRFEISVAEFLPVARAEEALVEQVVRNLLTNAAKYGPPDGRIEVIVDAPDGWPRVRVLDEGPGIDPNEAERLFELFYRSSRTSRIAGSGIGLFVARRLVESMGGSIWARPRADRPGSEFGIRLQPLREEMS